MLVTALATPFAGGKIDVRSYERLVCRQKDVADALLAVGTTAESPLLGRCEKKLLVRLAKGLAPHLPLWAGVEQTNVTEAVKEAVLMQQWGADGILLAPPAFVKCTAEGFVRYVEAILAEISVPLMLYNVPSRCAYSLPKEVIERLSDRVHHLKETECDPVRLRQMCAHMQVLCGNDVHLRRMLAEGACGAVSVVSNVAPQLVQQVICGRASQRQIHRYERLAALATLEVNPIAIKYMLCKQGVFDGFDVRLPLTCASADTRRQIDEAWEAEEENL